MHPDCLLHRLIADEREFFNSNGYLVVENALDQATVHRLVGVIKQVAPLQIRYKNLLCVIRRAAYSICREASGRSGVASPIADRPPS